MPLVKLMLDIVSDQNGRQIGGQKRKKPTGLGMVDHSQIGGHAAQAQAHEAAHGAGNVFLHGIRTPRQKGRRHPGPAAHGTTRTLDRPVHGRQETDRQVVRLSLPPIGDDLDLAARGFEPVDEVHGGDFAARHPLVRHDGREKKNAFGRPRPIRHHGSLLTQSRPFPAGQGEDGRPPLKIARGHSPRVLRQTVQPFEPGLAKEFGRALLPPGQEIDARPDAKRQPMHPPRPAEIVREELLFGEGQADEQQVPPRACRARHRFLPFRRADGEPLRRWNQRQDTEGKRCWRSRKASISGPITAIRIAGKSGRSSRSRVRSEPGQGVR